MFRLVLALVGFAVFGALFAGIYYSTPQVSERTVDRPKFRLAPLDVKPDFIEPAAPGENVTVNVTVLSGGPVDVYVLDLENLTLLVLNGTRYGFEADALRAYYNRTFSRENVTHDYGFRFVADGKNRFAVVFVSRVEVPENWTTLPAAEQERYVTEIGVMMRYLERERASLVLGYILAAPSVALVLVTLWLKHRRGRAARVFPPHEPKT